MIEEDWRIAKTSRERCSSQTEFAGRGNLGDVFLHHAKHLHMKMWQMVAPSSALVPQLRSPSRKGVAHGDSRGTHHGPDLSREMCRSAVISPHDRTRFRQCLSGSKVNKMER